LSLRIEDLPTSDLARRYADLKRAADKTAKLAEPLRTALIQRLAKANERTIALADGWAVQVSIGSDARPTGDLKPVLDADAFNRCPQGFREEAMALGAVSLEPVFTRAVSPALRLFKPDDARAKKAAQLAA
jgi:hypothetical protein